MRNRQPERLCRVQVDDEVEHGRLLNWWLRWTDALQDLIDHGWKFPVNCDSQEEIDRYWDALLEGGSPEACGWLKDRYGVSWQIVPTVLQEMVTDPDQDKAKRVTEALVKMTKFDVAELQRAYEGT